MTPEEGLDALEKAILATGIDVARDQLSGRAVVVARWTEFKWRWLATKLHLFLIACPFSVGEASTESLDRFLDAAREYAVSHKQGLPRGFQTGVAVIAVAVADELGGDAAHWASQPHGRRFAALAYPVSLDLHAGAVTRPDRMVLGAIYLPYLRRFVDQVVAPAVRR